MGKISDIIRISLDIQDKSRSYDIFGTPLIVSKFDSANTIDPETSVETGVLKTGTTFSNLIKFYNDIDSVAEQFALDSPQYLAALTAFSQKRKPKQIAIGRIPDEVNQTYEAGLLAIEAENNKFYGINILSRVEADILSASKYAEPRRKIFIAQSSDAGILANTQTDIAYKLKTDNKHRAALVYHASNSEYVDVAALALGLTYLPGTTTFARKMLNEVTVSNLTYDQTNNVLSKNANFYDEIADEGDFREGTMASGRFIDVTIAADYIQANLELRLYGLLKDDPKIPFTDAGIGRVRATIERFLSECTQLNIIADDPKYFVTAPRAINVPQADRAARKLTGMTFRCRLAGAIHSVDLVGTLTV